MALVPYVIPPSISQKGCFAITFSNSLHNHVDSRYDTKQRSNIIIIIIVSSSFSKSAESTGLPLKKAMNFPDYPWRTNETMVISISEEEQPISPKGYAFLPQIPEEVEESAGANFSSR